MYLSRHLISLSLRAAKAWLYPRKTVSLFWLIQGIHLKSNLLIINNIFGIVSSIFGIIRKIYLIKIKKDLILSQKEERKKIKKEKCMKLICSPGEEEFKFKGYQIIFKAPKEINNCNWVLLVNIKSEYELKNKIKEIKKISYIPKPQENEISDYFIKQTNIGNCFLVSSIISIINIPGILDYLFYFEDENKDNYTDSDKYIYLYCYLGGAKKIIKIKNTFPAFKNKDEENSYMKNYNLNSYFSPIPFTSTKNGILLGQILIKAFISLHYLNPLFKENLNSTTNNDINVFLTNNGKDLINEEYLYKDEDYTMSNIYKNLDIGGISQHPMDLFLGCLSENIYQKNIRNENDKKLLLKKLIKYIDIGGFIEVSNKGHAFSCEGYKKIKEGDKINYYFSIINPHRGGDTFEGDKINEKNIKEMRSPCCENEDNKEEIEKIKFINHIYPKTGHMMMKDDILLEWFYTITLSESMFGAKEILFSIEEKESINFEILSDTKICIDICPLYKKIEPMEINKYIRFNLKRLVHGEYEKIDFIEEKNVLKIYEKLNKGDYQLSFEILPNAEKIQFQCRIKYYESDYLIFSFLFKVENRNIFSEIKKLDGLSKEIITFFKSPENKKFKEILPENPKDNKIEIDYNNNTKLYWVKGNNIHKVYSENYKNYIIMIIYDLLYFVPCFIITYNKNKNEYKIEAPGNEYLVVDKDFKILKISEELKLYAKIGDELRDYYTNIEKEAKFNTRDKNDFSLENIFKGLLSIISILFTIIIVPQYIIFPLIRIIFKTMSNILKYASINQYQNVNYNYN